MDELRAIMERKLSALPGVTIARWKDTDLICVNCHGKEVGHFHGATVLDLRLSPKIIRQEGLSRDVSARFHPKRSQNSRWICVEFTSSDEVDRVVHLVTLACGERGM